MGLLRFLLIALLVYFVFRLFWRAYGPWILRSLISRFVKKVQEDMEKQQRAHQQAYDRARKYNRSQRVQVDDRTELHVPEPPKRKDGQDASKRRYRRQVEDVEFEELS